jgi:hypothetical protein
MDFLLTLKLTREGAQSGILLNDKTISYNAMNKATGTTDADN